MLYNTNNETGSKTLELVSLIFYYFFNKKWNRFLFEGALFLKLYGTGSNIGLRGGS